MKLFLFSFLFLITGFSSVNAQRSNPFDIKRTDTVEQVDASSGLIETIKPETKLDTENPFTVSHIPIRKNQYKQIEQLAIKDSREKENISISYLPLWLVVFSLSLLAFLLFKKKDHIYTLIRSIFNDNYMRLIAYEESSGLSLVYLMGYLLFVVNFSLFIFLVYNKLISVELSIGFYWFFIICCVYFIGKHIILSLFSLLFEFHKEAQVYGFTISTVNNMLALFFLCINIILLFGPEVWIKPLGLFGIFIFIIGLFSRYYKGLGIGRKYLNANFFHFFLYFCAFEFSPWLIIYSFLRDFI